MGERAERAARTRERIVAAARELALAGELDDSALEVVAQRAGVSRMTVYRIFGSRSELLEAMTSSELARVRRDDLDSARRHPDVRRALRDWLRENCRMFDELGDVLAVAIERARRDDQVGAVIEATYHGMRHRSAEELAGRLAREGVLRPGWTTGRVADALLLLTSWESFETLTRHRGHAASSAAGVLLAMADAFLEPPDRPAPTSGSA